jgi:hypothetical protein
MAAVPVSIAILHPPVVTGGMHTDLELQMDEKVPAGGQDVMLTYTGANVLALEPSEAVVPGGSETVRFQLWSTPVQQTQKIVIEARSGNTSPVSVTLTVNP